MKSTLEFFKSLQLKTGIEALAALSIMLCVSVFAASIAFICLLIITLKRHRNLKIKNHETDVYTKIDKIISAIVPD